jgi:hypothetical protein
VVRAVTVAPAASHGPLFLVGEQVQFRATSSYSDGAVSDCTTTAEWASSNISVARVSRDVAGAVEIVGAGDATIAARCGGVDGSSAVRAAREGLAISGLEQYAPFVAIGERIQLRAVLIGADATIVDCTSTASWESSAPRVIRAHTEFTASPGEFQGRDVGAATLSARCGNRTVEVPVTVDEWTLAGIVLPTDGLPVDAVVASLFGRHDTRADGRFSVRMRSFQTTLEVFRPGYEPRRFDVSWNRQATMDVDLNLEPVDGLLLSGSGDACKNRGSVPGCPANFAERVYRHPFSVPRTGLLRLDVYDEGTRDYYPRGFSYRILCDDAPILEVRTPTSKTASIATGTVEAAPGCRHLLEVTNGSDAAIAAYRFAISLR